MKKKLFALAVVAICFASCVGSTWAYFTAKGTAHNVITMNSIGITIVENGKATVDTPQESITDVMPGTTVPKVVTVKNSGNGDAWIRLKVEPSILNADGKPMSTTLSDGTSVMTYAIGDGWHKGADGYYYYNKIISAEESTGVFFEGIGFSAKMGNVYQNCTANLTITVQAVQAANNGTSVETAKGWPGNEEA